MPKLSLKAWSCSNSLGSVGGLISRSMTAGRGVCGVWPSATCLDMILAILAFRLYTSCAVISGFHVLCNCSSTSLGLLPTWNISLASSIASGGSCLKLGCCVALSLLSWPLCFAFIIVKFHSPVFVRFALAFQLHPTSRRVRFLRTRVSGVSFQWFTYSPPRSQRT